MTLTSRSLAETAGALTRRNSAATGQSAPPPFATQSPLHEILQEDIVGSLPPALQGRLRAAQSVEALNDWIAAGAVYSLVSPDSPLASEFLHQVGDDPRRAAWALVRAVAAGLEAPPVDARRRRLDRAGLGLQLAGAVLMLAGRSLLFTVLVQHGIPQPLAPDDLLYGLTGLDLLGGGWSGRLGEAWEAAVLACAAAWLACEAQLGPRLLEGLRRLPARLARPRLPPLLAWRSETFYLAFWLQTVLLLAALTVEQWRRVAALGASQLLGVPLVTSLLSAALLWRALAAARTACRLGTGGEPRDP